MKKYDHIVIVVKNWPDDPRLDCNLKSGMKEFMAVEASSTEENQVNMMKVPFSTCW